MNLLFKFNFINYVLIRLKLYIFIFEIAFCVVIRFIKIVAKYAAVEVVVVFSIHFV